MPIDPVDKILFIATLVALIVLIGKVVYDIVKRRKS